MKLNPFSKKQRIILLFSVFLNFLIPSFLLAIDSTCELVEVDFERPVIHKQYTPAEVQHLIDQQLEADGALTLNKAKGQAGELMARQTMENEVNLNGLPLISIFTLFEKMGCDVTHFIRSGADQGIDDIYVAVKPNGARDERYKPIFHEAKFAKACKPYLNSTKNICQQLSINWLDHNMEQTDRRAAAKGGNFCFPNNNEVNVTTCSDCVNSFKDEVTWLREKIRNKQFIRTVSVLCPTGEFKVYNVKQS